MEKCIPISFNHLIPFQKFKYSPLKLSSAGLNKNNEPNNEKSKNKLNSNFDSTRYNIANRKIFEKISHIFDYQSKSKEQFSIHVDHASKSYKYLNQSINYLNYKNIEIPTNEVKNNKIEIENKLLDNSVLNKLKEKIKFKYLKKYKSKDQIVRTTLQFQFLRKLKKK